MDCGDYRRLLLSEPGRPTRDMLTHVASCPECTRYTEQTLQFEGRLERALQVEVGEFAAARANIAGAAAQVGDCRQRAVGDRCCGGSLARRTGPEPRRRRRESHGR